MAGIPAARVPTAPKPWNALTGLSASNVNAVELRRPRPIITASKIRRKRISPIRKKPSTRAEMRMSK